MATETLERQDYPSVEVESEFGAVKLIINPDGAVISIPEEKPIVINRIAYYGTCHVEQQPYGYRVRYSYIKRAGHGTGSEPTSGASSAMYKAWPELVTKTLQRDPSLLVKMRTAEIANAIYERQSTIDARRREVALLEAEIIALRAESPEDGRPYMASYRMKGQSSYTEPTRIEFRAANDIAASSHAAVIAPAGAERYSVYSLPAAGVTDKARDLGPSFWVRDDA